MVSEREVLSENAASADETLSDEMLSVDTVMADGTGVLPVSPVQRPRKKVDKEEIAGTLFACIPLVGFLIFGFVPMLLALAMAFLNMYDWTFDGVTWAGWDNFARVFEDPVFWDSVGNTFILGSSVLFSQLFALIIAYFLNMDIKGKKTFRMIYFVPYVCSTVAVTLMWKYMFNTNYGIINQMLGRTGDNAIQWLGDSAYFSWAVIIMSVWSGMGYGIILYMAALTNVDKSMVEAATIDGAGSFKCFWSIVLPSISPTSFYLLVTGVIGALQAFATTNVLASDGGPNNDGVTMVFYLYRMMFNYYDPGRAAASVWFLAIIILAITGIQFFVSKRWVNYD